MSAASLRSFHQVTAFTSMSHLQTLSPRPAVVIRESAPPRGGPTHSPHDSRLRNFTSSLTVLDGPAELLPWLPYLQRYISCGEAMPDSSQDTACRVDVLSFTSTSPTARSRSCHVDRSAAPRYQSSAINRQLDEDRAHPTRRMDTALSIEPRHLPKTLSAHSAEVVEWK